MNDINGNNILNLLLWKIRVAVEMLLIVVVFISTFRAFNENLFMVVEFYKIY